MQEKTCESSYLLTMCLLRTVKVRWCFSENRRQLRQINGWQLNR